MKTKISRILITACIIAVFIDSHSPAQNVNNVLLEYCTGTWCQWCPCGHEVISGIMQSYPNTIVLAYHGAGSDPWQSYSDGIRSLFGFSAYPTGCVGRRTGIVSRSVWLNEVTIQSTLAPTMTIDIINKTFNPDTRTLNLKLGITADENLFGDYYMNIVLTEDSLVYSQTGNSSCIGGSGYIHLNVVKNMINGDAGELIYSGNWAAGTKVIQNLVYQVPGSPQISDVSRSNIVAFVYKQGGSISSQSYVQQAMKLKITGSDILNLSGNFFASRREILFGESVDFYDSSDGDILTWNWTFEGGIPETSTQTNPSNILYSEPGEYSVKLKISNSLGSDSIIKDDYIRVARFFCNTSWSQKMRIVDSGFSEDSTLFGFSDIGTIGIDSCLGEINLPPPPPLGVFDCRFILPTLDATKIDIRNDTSQSSIWRLMFQPSSAGYPIFLSWNPQSFPVDGKFILKDEITGAIVNINMRNQSSYVLTNPGITTLRIEYTYNRNISTGVSTGWNIVSVPLITDDMHYTSLFPGVASQAYGYSNGYISYSTLSCGLGYWMKFNQMSEFLFSGLPQSLQHIPVVEGWNLIGPFDTDIPVDHLISNPPGIIVSPAFGYNGGYTIMDTLKVGKGYWIRTTSAGYLYKGMILDNLALEQDSDPKDNFVELKFNGGEGNGASLYLANATQITSDYSLPPVPPQEIFDARFGSDKFVEELGKNHTLKISSNGEPVRLTVHKTGGATLRIKDAIDGSIFNKLITEGTEITIPANLNNLILETTGEIPLTYELSQNYPNPFNPSTTIKYQLPEDGIVKIIVFDILGREIKTLVNEFKSAGVYQIGFDASEISSGVYFYRMNAGNFEELKKMLIIK